MTDTTLTNALFGANAANPALKAVANVQKTAQTATNKTQDFGAVLDKTAQKFEKSDTTKQSAANNSTKSKSQQTADETKYDNAVERAGADETTSKSEKTVKDAAAKENVAEEPVDEMTIDEIAKALEQIIDQIKEILGITDEELLRGMEELGLQLYDLLNADNMTQLVTVIAGEDSAISLIADEGLYTALQDIADMVDTQVGSLLENTGLSSEELDAVLQKLQEMKNQSLEEQLQDSGILSFETVEESAEEQASDGPVIIKEDNTKADEQAADQYDTLPENQQENLTETGQKTQNTGKDAKDSDNKESKSFGQGTAAQNFQNNLNEVSDAAAAEGVEKFTSESTENLMRQLADMVKIVKNENLTEMELQLHPASLGTVNVSLTTKGGMVTAEFTTQNEAVKAAIEAQASQLKANLEEQGVKIEAIEVSVESHQMERELDKNGDQQQKQSQEQETGRIQGMRRGRSSINLRAFTDGEELVDEMQGADDATRIAMEIMAANGNT
ncbi:MAG: flagellar hook-length control protein FliK, partial [Lachnospiraceae bacterium]|nr:flagellar hook-length control protein FliK [Lachnospiraceae bacterium]